MARLRLLLLFISLFLLTSPSLSSSADESAIPYIYYYANTTNAIVVERADGTDSRLIAPGVMPPDHSVVSDLDWSPSGQWMAWRSSTYNGPGALSYTGWIARSDGSQRLRLLDNFDGDILTLQWSPNSDWLFVAHAQNRQLQLLIIDVNENKIIAQTTFQSNDWFPAWNDTFDAGWLVNGQEIYFIFPSLSIHNVGILTISNQTLNRIFSQTYFPDVESELIDFQSGRIFYLRMRNDMPGYELVMEDLSSGKVIVFDNEPDKETRYAVDWNPAMTHALIEKRQCFSQPCPPTQLYLLNWAIGEINLLDSGLESYDEEFFYRSELWSSEGRYTLLHDETDNPVLLDVISKQIYPIDVSTEIGYWDWFGTDSLYLLPKLPNSIIYQYDLINHVLNVSDLIAENVSGLSPSPDSRYIGLDAAFQPPYDMMNVETGETMSWPHHSLGASAGPILNYHWHSNSQWFMTNEMSTFSSGGVGPSAVTILNTDLSIRRELSICGYLSTCAGFVPDRILPHLGIGNSTSVIPEPQYSLPHDSKVVGVAWSPDGQQIASYTLNPDYNLGGTLYIWDVSDVPNLVTTYQTNFVCSTYPGPCLVSWSADGKTITLDDRVKREILDVKTGKSVEPDSTSSLCISQGVTSPDCNLAAITDANTITILQTATQRKVETITQEARIVGWSSDSSTLFLEQEFRDLILWKDGEINTLNESFGIYSADTQPTSLYVFGASLYHRIFVWNAETSERLPDINWYATAVSLSPDGTRLAAAGSSLVTIWDTSEFTP